MVARGTAIEGFMKKWPSGTPNRGTFASKVFATPENGFYIISVPEWAAICLAAALTNADAQDFQLDLLMPDDEPVQMDLMTIKAQA